MTAVAFVPAAPLLVAQVAGGSAHLDDELRDACRDAVGQLAAAADRTIVIAAQVAGGGAWSEESTWGFEGFGVARQPSDDRPRVPWPLGIGGWLLDDVGWSGPRRYLGIDPSVPQGDVDAADALLIVGDGSARRDEKAPGHLDERAADLDAAIARALTDGDVGALGGLDAELAADLLCAGAPVWRWLATTIGARRIVEAELLADTAPYGVGYFVAWWRLI